MTLPQRKPNFRVPGTATVAAHAALATLTVAGAVVVMVAVRCPPPCGALVLGAPDTVAVELRRVRSNRDASGRGMVVACRKCRGLYEVIQHR